MNTNKHDSVVLWDDFNKRHALSPEQSAQFQHYYTLVCAANELFNITAITQLQTFITHHLDDALALDAICDMAAIKNIADVGAGAGFPSIPLKIKYPHLALVLIEVSHKKGAFLNEVAEKLHLTDVSICDYDWRTFLRKINTPIDLFCARASLQPEELIRIFKPSSPYKGSMLVYWASAQWEPSSLVQTYITQDFSYKIAHKRRRLIVFRLDK